MGGGVGRLGRKEISSRAGQRSERVGYLNRDGEGQEERERINKRRVIWIARLSSRSALSSPFNSQLHKLKQTSSSDSFSPKFPNPSLPLLPEPLVRLRRPQLPQLPQLPLLSERIDDLGRDEGLGGDFEAEGGEADHVAVLEERLDPVVRRDEVGVGGGVDVSDVSEILVLLELAGGEDSNESRVFDARPRPGSIPRELRRSQSASPSSPNAKGSHPHANVLLSISPPGVFHNPRLVDATSGVVSTDLELRPRN